MTTQLDDKIGFNAFGDQWQDHVRLVLDTIAMRPTQGIPTFMLHDMQWSHLETFSGNPPGSYEKEPVDYCSAVAAQLFPACRWRT